MKLQEYDILFLLDKTKLSLKPFLNLIEEERDFNLVIDSIASKIQEDDIKQLSNLSDKLRIKLILYHTSKDKNYDISEKSYISDIIVNNYNQIYKCRLPKKSEKKEIKHFISIINGLHMDKQQLSEAMNNFHKLGKKDICHHLFDWISIIKKSKELVKQCVTNSV